MEEVPWNADQTVEYEKKIQELGRQIKQLQEAANPKDYSGKIKCQNISCLVGMYFFFVDNNRVCREVFHILTLLIVRGLCHFCGFTGMVHRSLFVDLA